ncbi:MAG: choice-of-anchor F family protein [Desulfobulbaceae bacterium]|nr:choice-of-anchor F family protein [Desulfobulbaceae bacterium]
MKKTILISAAFGVLAAGIAQAGVIDGWDKSLVVTDAEPVGGYVDYTTYNSIIYLDDSMTTTNGRIVWKHGDVQPDGLKVVNGDDVDGTNCLMTTGYNPYDLSDKQCSDPLQSSKRTKVKNTVSAPLDVDFTVSPGPTTSYRMLQKLTDATVADRWSGFTIQLGTRDADGTFVASANGDGLGFSDNKGNIWSTTVTTDTQKDLIFSANFAQGLAGPADKYHPVPGYFNPFARMIFSMAANENTITSTGISATYSDVFGQWVNSAGAPIAIFYDDDGDINSDNILTANCADSANLGHVGTHTGDDITGLTCNGTWVTFRGSNLGTPEVIADLEAELGQTVYTSVTEAIAAVAAGEVTNPMYMDYIEDAANLGLNFWITVEDSFASDNIVIRYTPVVAQ